MNGQRDLNGNKLARIGERTELEGPVSYWGEEVPLYKLKDKHPVLFTQDWIIHEFQTITKGERSWLNIRCSPVDGFGPNGEVDAIAVSTGAKSVVARLYSLEPGDFPLIGRFKMGPEGPNQWFDLE